MRGGIKGGREGGRTGEGERNEEEREGGKKDIKRKGELKATILCIRASGIICRLESK